MYKVITSSNHQYVGCSEKLAEQFYSAAMKTGLCALMMKRVEGKWIDVKEHIPE